MDFSDTLRNKAWLAAHERELRAILPETWTHIENISALQLSFKLKLIGLDWRSSDDFADIMVTLDKIGILQHQGKYLHRRSPHPLFNEAVTRGSALAGSGR